MNRAFINSIGFCMSACLVLSGSAPGSVLGSNDALAPATEFSDNSRHNKNKTGEKFHRWLARYDLLTDSAIIQNQFDRLMSALSHQPWVAIDEEKLRDKVNAEKESLARALALAVTCNPQPKLKGEHIRPLCLLCDSSAKWGGRLQDDLKAFLITRVVKAVPPLVDDASFRLLLGDLHRKPVTREMQEIRAQAIGITAAAYPNSLDALMDALRRRGRDDGGRYLAYALGVAAWMNPPLLDRMKDVLKSPIGLVSMDLAKEGNAQETSSRFVEGLLSRVESIPTENPPAELPKLKPLTAEIPTHGARTLDELLPGMEFVRAQGRTLIYRADDGRCVGVKLLAEGESANVLEYEQRWMDYLHEHAGAMGLEGTYPRSALLDGKRIGRISSLGAIALAAFQRQRNKLGEPMAADFRDGLYTFMAYEVPDDGYFRYLNDPALSAEEFLRSSRIGLHDIFRLARYGVIHTAIIDLYHTPDAVERWEDDRGRFLTLVDIINPAADRGVGRLYAWTRAVLYPNLRQTGVADMAEMRTIGELLDPQNIFSLHLQTLAKEHPDYPKQTFYLASYLADYLLGWSLLLASHARETDRLDWKNPDALAEQLRQGYALAFEAFAGEGVDYAIVGDAIDWRRAAMQLAYVAAKGDVYADDLMRGEIPIEMFNLPKGSIRMGIDAVSARNWRTTPQRRGWYGNNLDPDIGPQNGPIFIQELVKAWILHAGGMMEAVVARGSAAIAQGKPSLSGSLRILAAVEQAP